MLQLERLRVSLTKNGYLKIANLVRHHARWDVLGNAEGSHHGINIKRSQISNIMCADPITGQLPEFWDGIKRFRDEAIDAFTLVAVILSHEKLIETFRRASAGNMRRRLRKERHCSRKEYTNLVYAMASLGLCQYVKGADVVAYDFYRLIYNLRGPRRLVQLIESKLERCGWLDPRHYPHSTDGEFFAACQ